MRVCLGGECLCLPVSSCLTYTCIHTYCAKTHTPRPSTHFEPSCFFQLNALVTLTSVGLEEEQKLWEGLHPQSPNVCVCVLAMDTMSHCNIKYSTMVSRQRSTDSGHYSIESALIHHAFCINLRARLLAEFLNAYNSSIQHTAHSQQPTAHAA